MTYCEECGRSGWIILEGPNGVTCAKPCDCRRTKRTEPPLGQTTLTPETAAFAVEGLCETLDYAPRTEVGKAIITSCVLSMCYTVEQATWLVQRVCMLHTSWSTCGLPGRRQIFGSKYAPLAARLSAGTTAINEAGMRAPGMLVTLRP